jgi:hypothetical protein
LLVRPLNRLFILSAFDVAAVLLMLAEARMLDVLFPLRMPAEELLFAAELADFNGS